MTILQNHIAMCKGASIIRVIKVHKSQNILLIEVFFVTKV